MENFKPETESDPTLNLRETLVSELQSVAVEADAKVLEKFKKGVFLVPSETVKRIQELIDSVSNDDEREKLRKLYNDILEQA